MCSSFHTFRRKFIRESVATRAKCDMYRTLFLVKTLDCRALYFTLLCKLLVSLVVDGSRTVVLIKMVDFEAI